MSLNHVIVKTTYVCIVERIDKRNSCAEDANVQCQSICTYIHACAQVQ